MNIYHGSNVIVDNPRLLIPNRNLDFGAGFYTTSNPTQAFNFAEKVTQRRKSGKSTVSVYELDESYKSSLKILSFPSADESWLDFVSGNRAGTLDKCDYDLVSGPVANDDVYQTFILYTSGILTKEQTLDALKIKNLYDQYVFTTDKGLSFLKFVRTIYNPEV